MKELALHILDIAQNSIRAKATEIHIDVSESKANNRLAIEVRDNGSGIPPPMLDVVTDPFTTSRKTRRVGMGLPLLRQHAEMTGGRLEVRSASGKGTTVRAEFVMDHIDLQPMGDLPGVIKLLLAANPGIDFFYSHSTDMGTFSFSGPEAKDILEVANFNDYHLQEQIKSLISENLADLGIEWQQYRISEYGDK